MITSEHSVNSNSCDLDPTARKAPIIINPHLGLALEIKREDVLSPPRLTLPNQEGAVAGLAVLGHQLGGIHPGEGAVEPGVVLEMLVYEALRYLAIGTSICVGKRVLVI